MAWFGPTNADCNCCGECVCTFSGGFAYDDAGLGSVCLLQFAVGAFCAGTDVENADITIDIEVNGSPVSGGPVYDSVFNGFIWEKWKPTAGDVYTADVTLDCGGGNTYTQSYSFTIPTPANTSCVCCTELTPDYLVISGGADCCDMANGTWALSSAGGTCAAGTRNYEYVDNDIFSAPSSPCGGGECFSDFDAGTGRTYYFWRRGINLRVTMPASAGPDNITIAVSYVYRVYVFFGGCTLSSSAATISYTYTLTCSGGDAGSGSGGSIILPFGFLTTPCASGPSVELFFT